MDWWTRTRTRYVYISLQHHIPNPRKCRILLHHILVISAHSTHDCSTFKHSPCLPHRSRSISRFCMHVLCLFGNVPRSLLNMYFLAVGGRLFMGLRNCVHTWRLFAHHAPWASS